MDVDSLGAAMIVLFGSQARGTAGDRSDTDVGVLLAPGVEWSIEIADRIRNAMGGADDLDVSCLNRADPLLLYQVAIDGRLLAETEPGTWERFRLRAIKLYWDTARFRALEAEALQRRYG